MSLLISRNWMKCLCALFVFIFMSQSSVAESSVWKLGEHQNTVDGDRPKHHYNEETGEISMRGDLGLKYNTLQFYPMVKIEENMVVKWDVRREIDFHKAVKFVVSFATRSGAAYYLSDAISEDSKSYALDLANLRNKEGEPFKKGDKITEFRLYATNKSLVPDMNMNFAVRDFRFVIESGDGSPVDDGSFYSVIPHFQWASQETDSQRLQYARTPDFSDDGSLHDVRLTEPQHVPEKALEPGRWYWRYYRKDPLSDRWSDVHQFTISEKAHQFRLPKIDVEALAKKSHPRLAGLQTVFLDDDLREQVLETIKDPIPKDGVARVGSGLSKVGWLTKVRNVIVAPTVTRLKNYGQYLLATDDPEVREDAIERLLEVAKWDPDGASSEISNDLASGNLLIGMCWLFDAVYDDLIPAEREEVMDSLEVRCAQFAEAGVVPMELNPAQNHTWKKAEAVGVGAMVLLGHREPARYWFESIRNDFAYRFLPSMGFEGENQEGISYWRYGGEMLVEYVDILQAFSGDNLYEHEWLKNTANFPIYSAPPGGYATSFADTHGNGNHTVRGPYALYSAGDFLAHLTKKTGFPYGAWYRGETIPGAKDQRPPADLESFKHWDHIGWALFNTCLPNGYENVSIGLHAGKYFAGHQHADQNSFVINAYGDKLAIDGGAYDWYRSPHFTAYAYHTKAHNTVLVNGEGQAWREEGADGVVETFYSSLPYDYTKGDASDSDIYQGALPRFKRKLLFIKPDYVVVHDQLVAAKPKSEFEWLIHSHTGKPIAFDDSKKTFSIVRPLARLDGAFLFPEDMSIRVEKSYTELPCKTYSYEVRDSEFIEPEWTLFGKAAVTNSSGEYFVVMRISKTPNDKSLDLEKFETDSAYGVTIRESGRVIHVLSRKDGRDGTLTRSGVVTDADIACVELDGQGVPQSAFIGQGTTLTVSGQPILKKNGMTNAHYNVQEEWAHRQLNPVSLAKGLPPFKAYVSQMNRGTLYMYSAEVDVSSNTVFTLDLSGISNPVYAHVNGGINTVPTSGEISLEVGSWFLTLSSLSDLSANHLENREK